MMPPSNGDSVRRTRLCGHCGYDMGGILEDGSARVTCPECGETLSPAEGPFVEPGRGGPAFWASLLWPPAVLALGFACAYVLTQELIRAGVLSPSIPPAVVAGIVGGCVAGWAMRRVLGNIRLRVDRHVPAQQRRRWWTSWLVGTGVVAACFASGLALIRLYLVMRV